MLAQRHQSRSYSKNPKSYPTSMSLSHCSKNYRGYLSVTFWGSWAKRKSKEQFDYILAMRRLRWLLRGLPADFMGNVGNNCNPGHVKLHAKLETKAAVREQCKGQTELLGFPLYCWMYVITNDTKFSTLSDSGLKTRFFKDEQTSDASDHSRTKISKIHR